MLYVVAVHALAGWGLYEIARRAYDACTFMQWLDDQDRPRPGRLVDRPPPEPPAFAWSLADRVALMASTPCKGTCGSHRLHAKCGDCITTHREVISAVERSKRLRETQERERLGRAPMVRDPFDNTPPKQ